MARIPTVKFGTVSGSDSAVGYGGISVSGGSTAISSITTTYVQVTIFDTNDDSDTATTPDHTNDHITIVDAGTYLVTGSFSFSGTASTTFEIQAEKNNGATTISNCHIERALSAGGDIGSASFAGIHTFAANDTLEAWVRAVTGSGKSITIKDACLSVIKLVDA